MISLAKIFADVVSPSPLLTVRTVVRQLHEMWRIFRSGCTVRPQVDFRVFASRISAAPLGLGHIRFSVFGLKLVRQGAKLSAAGAAVGGLTTTAVVARYSRAPHGLLLSLAAGAMVGWCVAEEGARVALGLHKFDCMDTNLRFLDWWKHKTEG
ncbi:hypothetical protein L7F22_015836 [Adiantum nelumboides]|nr:hypothetical protein [Adiantum nelumboides]